MKIDELEACFMLPRPITGFEITNKKNPDNNQNVFLKLMISTGNTDACCKKLPKFPSIPKVLNLKFRLFDFWEHSQILLYS